MMNEEIKDLIEEYNLNEDKAKQDNDPCLWARNQTIKSTIGEWLIEQYNTNKKEYILVTHEAWVGHNLFDGMCVVEKQEFYENLKKIEKAFGCGFSFEYEVAKHTHLYFDSFEKFSSTIKTKEVLVYDEITDLLTEYVGNCWYYQALDIADEWECGKC